MENRPDTSSSSGRFRGQWSFLANPPQHAQPRSLPPSSYILHSDRSSISPLPTGLHYQAADGSRSSLPKNLTTASSGGRSSATIPSQPVLIRVHSADASAHTNPAPRPRRPISMNKQSGLPALSEFSIQGILAAIQEDVESDINTISEILGRSRLVLADQHDSHMPPQGEIRAMPNTLQVVEEASSDSERLAMDDVLIVREDASLIDGSHAGSAAYGLLERLQALPRSSRMHSGLPHSRGDRTRGSPVQANSTPTPLSSETLPEGRALPEVYRASTRLLQTSPTATRTPRTTDAVVSEIYLSAGANGSAPEGVTLLHDHDHMSPGSELDNTDVTSSSSVGGQHQTLRERVQSLLYVSDPTGLSAWLQGQTRSQGAHSHTAEEQLRDILER